LLALDAEVELTSSTGRRYIRLSNFIVGDRKTLRRGDEILTAIIVPRRIESGSSVFSKLGIRRFLAASIVTVAAIVEQDPWGRVRQARVAVGGCSAVAQRLRRLECKLTGKIAELGLGELVVEPDLATLSPIDDVHGSAAYKRDAALTLARRAIDACVGGR
jgi:CO/xanthine dehydrogenase FAD-binding subunit